MATLAVLVSPRSAENSVIGWSNGSEERRELHIKLTASPTDGKANEALIKLLAKELGIPKSCITIKSGHASRHKLLEIDRGQLGLDDALERFS